ncbi:MAG TPA: CHAT domain-containing protein [Burkholderiales bacterium]
MARKKTTRKPASRRTRSAAATPAPALPSGAAGAFVMDNDEIERALRTGQDAGVLEDYFGPRDYAELRELAQQGAAKRAAAGPKVLILPGITGSRLGQIAVNGQENIVWFDPVELAFGAIRKLAMGSGVKIVPLGVILLYYLKLKLRLRALGFDADFYPYDWRQSLDTLGMQLAERIRNDPALDGVSLVCHSMGGLVARAAVAALGAAGKKIGRVVQLGTPNFGSFCAVQTMRAQGDTVKKLAFLDQRHDAQELVADVLAPMPGFCQLLPSPERFNAIDLFDAKRWPASRPHPQAEVLRQVPGVLKKLAGADERFTLIAGINRETVTGVRKDEQKDEFVFQLSMAGDGTVPLALAELPGVKATYYIEETHGSLPNNKIVARAVADILSTGATSLLPSTVSAVRREVTREVSESALATQHPYPGRRQARLSQRELREVLSEFVSAETRDAEQPMAAAEAAAAAADLAQRFDRLVIGRRRQHRMDLRLALGDVGDVNATALMIGIYRSVAPSGAAKAIDARLDGAITELTQRRMFSGNVGEVFLLPTAQRAVRADMVGFIGLGAFDTFTEEVLRIAAENAIRTLVLGGVYDVATVLIGGGSGAGARSAVENLLAGFVKGLMDTDAGHRFRCLTVCEGDPQRYEEIKRELFRLSSTSLFDELEVTFFEERLPPVAAVAPAGRRAAARPDPVYLLVRQEGKTASRLELRTSVLGAGGKATVVSGVRQLKRTDLDGKLDELQTSGFRFDRAPVYGRELASLVVSDEALAALAALKDRHVVVVHDAESSRIPWELLAVAGGGQSTALLAKEGGLSRRYVADNLSVAKWLEERRQDLELNLLLVVNPTLDLDGAEEEGRRVRELLAGEPAVRIDELRGRDASRPALERAFRSGKYDVIHYAGHAFFDEADPAASGILCAGKAVLSGRDLAGLGNLPALVFFNACEAGRVRRAGRAGQAAPSMRERIDRNVGLAEAFLRGGVANYVGTYWPVGDEPAKLFAEQFYRSLMQGQSIGDALLAGRRTVWDRKSVDWADYIHYGSHDFVLKTR